MRLVLVSASLLLALAAGAPAATHGARLAVRPALVSPGAAIRVVGDASPCHAGNTVQAISKAFPGHAYGGEGALHGRVRAGGAFTISGRVRATLAAGRYAVTARCGGGNLGVTAYVRVR